MIVKEESFLTEIVHRMRKRNYIKLYTVMFCDIHYNTKGSIFLVT